jgi:hypothetical protein
LRPTDGCRDDRKQLGARTPRVQLAGAVDEFHVDANGTLSPLGSVAGLGAGIEGIATD